MAVKAKSESPASTERRQLFNGHDLTVWLWWTGGKISNSVIRVVFKMRDHNDNSGVFIRIPIEPREEWMPVQHGYEVQIDNEPEKSNETGYHATGSLYSQTNAI